MAESRERAKALIMAGQVYLNGQKALKAGTFVAEKDSVEVRGEKMPFVSRGGYKLDKAVKCFGLDLHDKICMDIGASTGGFTDCMLQNGAKKVYAVDVGYGQLAWKLRTDERVVNMERTNFRYITPDMIDDRLDFASIDVSFISLKIILPVLASLMNENAQAVCLIKPQFEAGREKIGKKGVVRDKAVHAEVIENVLGYVENSLLFPAALDFSPVKGPEGNIEYILLITNNSACEQPLPAVSAVVEASHSALD